MRSVAWTDVIQGILLVFGMLVAGIATVSVLGGVGGFFEAVSSLPASSLSVPGTTGHWTPEMLFTVCFFASMGSMVQPAQWMRYYAARSTQTLRQSALIFTVVLTVCFLFGIMLVGLGGQALYPLEFTEGGVLPHASVGAAGQFDQILVVVLRNHLPELLGTVGMVLASLILISIMAAAMSTADSNLHALSAILTRDIYDRFIKPGSTQQTRTWVGRSVICFATILSLFVVIISRTSEEVNLVGMIAQLGLMAIAFSSQLLPLTFDMLYIQKGTREGAYWGLLGGLVTVFFLSPMFQIISGAGSNLTELATTLKSIFDVGAWGLAVNCILFIVISAIIKRTGKKEREGEAVHAS